MNLRKNLRRVGRLFSLLLFLFILYLALVLALGTATDFQPEAVTEIQPDQTSNQTIVPDSILRLAIWNIGYGGLGEESDFFYDSGHMLLAGGKMIRPSRQMAEKNLDGISLIIANTQSDFFLLQEIDRRSRRSYYLDQYQVIAERLPGFSAAFATNFKVRFVPLPLMEPWAAYGSAYSGLANFSRWKPTETVRYQLPGAFSWPKRIFQLDRCILLQRFALSPDRELTLINVHNSAHDLDGALKKQEMAFLRELLLSEYARGRYVIAGGDWNMCPPYFRFDGFMPGRSQGYTQLNIDADFLPPDWKWTFDPAVPTNRKTRTPYLHGETFITTIDFFLSSPNVRVRQVKTLDQGFRFSDHQPVWLEVELK